MELTLFPRSEERVDHPPGGGVVGLSKPGRIFALGIAADTGQVAKACEV